MLSLLCWIRSSEGKQCVTFLPARSQRPAARIVTCDVGCCRMLCAVLGIMVGLPLSLFVQLHFGCGVTPTKLLKVGVELPIPSLSESSTSCSRGSNGSRRAQGNALSSELAYVGSMLVLHECVIAMVEMAVWKRLEQLILERSLGSQKLAMQGNGYQTHSSANHELASLLTTC